MFGTRLISEGVKDLAPVRQITTQTKEASALLTKVFDHNGNGTEKYSLRIKEINEFCNAVVRQTAERLKHSFGSLFDRQDIYDLVLGMSTVVHRVEMLATSVNRYRPRYCTSEMIELADRIRLIVLELDQVIPMINRPTELQVRIRIVREIQKESRDLYRDAVTKLFRSNTPPTDALMYVALYHHLDSIVEECEHVACLVERISIKHA